MGILANPRHERFAQALAKGKTATEAYVEAGYEPCESVHPAGYYVYVLADPTDGKVFYVGKGRGRRAWQHFREWRRGKVCNPAKFTRIAEIAEAGHEPSVFVLASGLQEPAAYQTERQVIACIGLANLTNAVRGASSEEARALAMATDSLSRIIPFDIWMAIEERTPLAVWVYHDTVKFLNEMRDEMRARLAVT